ncbi:hypothetical protein ACOSQ4_013346 [Xanthoceras sorbifolium]
MDVKELPEDKENGNAWNATTTATKAGKNKDWGNAIINSEPSSPPPSWILLDFLLCLPIRKAESVEGLPLLLITALALSAYGRLEFCRRSSSGWDEGEESVSQRVHLYHERESASKPGTFSQRLSSIARSFPWPSPRNYYFTCSLIPWSSHFQLNYIDPLPLVELEIQRSVLWVISLSKERLDQLSYSIRLLSEPLVTIGRCQVDWNALIDGQEMEMVGIQDVSSHWLVPPCIVALLFARCLGALLNAC